MPKPRRIILIRHGQSQSNVDVSLHARVPDHKIALTDLGRQQAAQAGESIEALLAGERVAVYCSPFLRTRQTAEGILSRMPAAQIERYREDPRIREQEWGNFQNLGEIEKVDKERTDFGIFFYRLPNGESGADVFDRVTTFLDTLYRDFQNPAFPENVLIVTHGITLRLILTRWFHWTVEQFESTKNPGNCQFCQMQLDATGHYALLEPFPTRAKSAPPLPLCSVPHPVPGCGPALQKE